MQRPSALGLLLCEQVIRDSETGRRTFVGAFDSLTADEFPFVSPPLTVYAALTNGQGRIRLELRVTDIDDEVDLAVEGLTVDLPGPLDLAHVRFRFRGLSFPEPGHYLFQLFAENEPICHRRLHIRESEEEP
jgi:hypothetical protein